MSLFGDARWVVLQFKVEAKARYGQDPSADYADVVRGAAAFLHARGVGVLNVAANKCAYGSRYEIVLRSVGSMPPAAVSALVWKAFQGELGDAEPPLKCGYGFRVSWRCVYEELHIEDPTFWWNKDANCYDALDDACEKVAGSLIMKMMQLPDHLDRKIVTFVGEEFLDKQKMYQRLYAQCARALFPFYIPRPRCLPPSVLDT